MNFFFFWTPWGRPGATLGYGWASGTWSFLGRQATYTWSPPRVHYWPQVCGRNAGANGGAGEEGWDCQGSSEDGRISLDVLQLRTPLPADAWSRRIAGDLFKAGVGGGKSWGKNRLDVLGVEGLCCRLVRRELAHTTDGTNPSAPWIIGTPHCIPHSLSE